MVSNKQPTFLTTVSVRKIQKKSYKISNKYIENMPKISVNDNMYRSKASQKDVQQGKEGFKVPE